MKTIDLMVSSGLQKAGYKYFCLDGAAPAVHAMHINTKACTYWVPDSCSMQRTDAWAEPLRDEEGRVLPHKRRFPDGVKPIADYAHSKGMPTSSFAYYIYAMRPTASLNGAGDAGLLFGIYSDAGDRTCLGYPGSRYGT